MTVGQRVREKRSERKLTLKQMAEKTGLSLTYLSDVERDRTRPSVKTLMRIAEAFGITTTDLLHGVEALGDFTEEAIPEGLRELRDDPYWAKQIDEEWERTLLRVDYRGKRPRSKDEWIQVFVTLRGVLGERP